MSRIVAGIALVALANGVWAQNPPSATASATQKAAAPARKDSTSGFAINDQAVIQNCSRCHVRDSSGVMQRLSYMRKTPEGWEISLRRMVALQHVRVDPATARAIIKYLSNAQGLAPAEARPARFESERRA